MTKSYKTIQENCIFTTFFKKFLDPQEINSKDPSFARDQKLGIFHVHKNDILIITYLFFEKRCRITVKSICQKVFLPP